MRKMMIAGAALMAATTTPAFAQVNLSQGLVDVTIQNVSILNDFLNHDQIMALSGLSVPVTVQVPVGVAAAVCGVDANVIAKQKKSGDYSCPATTGSKALAQSVAKQKLSQKK